MSPGQGPASTASSLQLLRPVSSANPTSQEAIHFYLGPPTPQFIGLQVMHVRESALHAGLREARSNAGRRWCNGSLATGQPSGSWAATLIYFSILDQLGGAVKPRTWSGSAGRNDFDRALRYYLPPGRLPKKERELLYELRNAFVHDFCLMNVRKRPERRWWHSVVPRQWRPGRRDPGTLFTLDGGATGNMVDRAQRRWNGGWGDADRIGAHTTINIRAFGDMVEEIIREVRRLGRAGELEVALPGGPLELATHYALHFDADFGSPWAQAVARRARGQATEFDDEFNGWPLSST